MLECVPNFSEGADSAKVCAIVEAIRSAGVSLLGWESDLDHNRSVVTFAGSEDAVVEGAVRGAGKAAELIDLNAHQGVHPRVGAADVIPFVPLEGSMMEEAAAAAHRAGQEIWSRFGIPIYFYEAAAMRPERKRLERVRRAGFDGAPPDIGTLAAHPRGGASMVGARGFLVAFNVDLKTADVAVANAIARKIRESSGGFRFVKAMGLYLESRGRAQVSMNLTNFAETPLNELLCAIEREAPVADCELIGLIPRRAFEMFPDFFRRASNFNESRIIENRLLPSK